ncbi:MAG: hypothetical protein JKY54_10465 [Flavobacteriales bacterium]|nr:hypothetical protein [Flavobacteriales bacterium]
MIALIPNENITTQDLKLLRKVSDLSISEIKHAAINRTPIATFEQFGSNWETDRTVLAKLANNYIQEQNLPYQFALIEDSEIDEFLKPENLKNVLQSLRQIELETQRNTDLEMGYISNPLEFEPHDDDWTILE